MKLNKIEFLKNRTKEIELIWEGEDKYQGDIKSIFMEGINTNKIILDCMVCCWNEFAYRVCGEIILDKDSNILECHISNEEWVGGKIIIS